jgi:diadenosine tetraphosphatase ApaH/serine/threonine PP2A family protein phosphatase
LDRFQRSGRDAEDIELVLAGLMCGALPLPPPTRGVSPSPAPCGAAAP